MALIDADEQYEVTVHHFTPEDAEDSSISDQGLLDDAAALVASIRDETSWHSPPKVDFSVFCLTGKGLQYSAQPPAVCGGESHLRTIPTLDWEAPLDPEEEEWTLEDIQPFDHGLLHDLLVEADRSPRTTAQDPSVIGDRAATAGSSVVSEEENKSSAKRKNTSQIAASPPRKRPRLDEGSLFDVVPFPHFQACLMTFDNPWPALVHSEFYSAAPKPIPPHTHTTMEEHIAEQFSRLAWIIPVRGDLPWKGATPASMLAESPDDGTPGTASQAPIPEAPHQNPHSPAIVWTRDALRTFWKFLTDLKDTNNVGPISLAFYHPPGSHARSSAEQFSYVGSHKQDSALERSPSAHGDSVSNGLEAPRSTLCQTVHIKVYHDAPYTKLLRNLFNAWSYRKPGVKVRVLKGATLALLDETNKGLLLC